MTDPFTVTDELYIHQYADDVTIHYATETPGGPEPGTAVLPGRPEFLSEYLRAEQRLGRVRADLDPSTAAVVMLALLFGLSARPRHAPAGTDVGLAAAVDLMVRGLQ